MKNIFILFIMCIVFAACNKVKIELPEDFNVSANSTVKAGTKLTFNLEGNPDDIVFYSGELNRNYDLRNVTRSTANGNPEFEFLSNIQAGAGAGVSNLSILVSNDFSGQYDTTSVKAAIWTNITSRAVLGTTPTNLSSGIISLNDLKVENKPLYIAFRYVSNNINLKQQQWTISGFQFRTRFADGKVFTGAASNTDVGFGPISFKGDSARWVSSASLTHVGLIAGKPLDDDWAISKPFDLSVVTADSKGSLDIKAIYQAPIKTYSYTYTVPGTYTATFVATNQKNGEQKQTVRQVNITVSP